MHLALTVPFSGIPLTELPALVRQAEDSGYESVWSQEATELDGFTPLTVAALNTERMRLVTGIVSVYTRGPTLLAQSATALSELSGGRFVLGLGASSNVIVEQWNGIPFERPLARVRDTVDYLRRAFAGERVDGGFKLNPAPSWPIPIVLAALRDRMLKLAAERADGAFTNFLPQSGVPKVVEAFGSPQKELACRFFSMAGDDDEVLTTAKRIFVGYATVPVYTEFFRWLGWGDEVDQVVDAWKAGDRQRAVELAPEQLVREIFLLGPVEAQRERLAAFAEAGITTAALTLLWPPERMGQAIDAFAPR
jgi:probable F420-dependent oxidoreductase